eukprot:360365-Chlamydomonas_euryale.AAC.11
MRVCKPLSLSIVSGLERYMRAGCGGCTCPRGGAPPRILLCLLSLCWAWDSTPRLKDRWQVARSRPGHVKGVCGKICGQVWQNPGLAAAGVPGGMRDWGL